ncbi:MAG: phosphodiester glycosidase family protein [Clostridia bacterium]|nr:phosphodiester glycosidase family protein [Clostridia bacterium]
MSKIILDNDKEIKEVEKNAEKTQVIHNISNIKNEINREKKVDFNEREYKEFEPTKKLNKLKIFGLFILTLIAIGIVSFDVLLYGPNYKFRDWLVTNAMNTLHHKYLATWFYSDAEIEEVMARNRVIEVGENTDTSLLKDVPPSIKGRVSYANEYEREILEREEGQDYKIIELHDDDYDGYLAVIYEPSRISVVTSNSLGSSGQYLVDMAKNNNAAVAINGGGFADEGGNGSGGIPYGLTFSDGELKYNYGYRDETFSLIGFDNNNNLVLGRYNQYEAKEIGIRDAVTFSPFLIVNGKSSEIEGNGGWGYGPRTAIGQRADKIVLFVVIDGRRINKQGASMADLISIFERYGAVNAANLDGGTSSAMVVENEIINDPMDASGNHRTRPVATSFIFK